jgi:transmembrane sensor
MNEQLAARAEAAAWITRLHGPNRSAEMEAGFHRWLSENAENRAEFEALTDIWAAVGTLPKGGTPRLESWEHSAESRELQQLRSRLRGGSAWRAAGRGAALAAGVFLIGVLAFRLLENRIESSYATDVGEQRVVQLADKSRIWMNSETRVRIAFDSRQRQVELIRGEAFFEVTREAPRPFIVLVGGHRVTVLGTSFVVRYESDHTAVTLVQGKVAISSASTPSDPAPVPDEPSRARGAERPRAAPGRAESTPWILSAGQRLTFLSAGTAKIDAPPVENVLAWRRGEVVLSDTPLQEAVSEMNHYDKTPIVIEGPGVAMLTVSGLYHTGDNDGFARSIAKMYRLDLDERDGRIYLKSH